MSDSMGGPPKNHKDGSHTCQLRRNESIVIQIPATGGQAQRPFRGCENPYFRGRNNLPPCKNPAPGNPNIRQTILIKTPNESSPSADFRAPKRQKFDNNASSQNVTESTYGATRDFDEPPRSTVPEVIDLQMSSDDLEERIPAATSSSPGPLWATTSSKGKGRAEESHIVMEGSEEEGDIEEFPSSNTRSNARVSVAIPKDIVQGLKMRFQYSRAPAPATVRQPIEKMVNCVDPSTGRVVTMKNKDGDVLGKPKGTDIFHSVGASSSNFLNSPREKKKTQVLPLIAWCLGHHHFRHSKAAPAKLRFEGAEQRIIVSWGQPPEHIEFEPKEAVRSVKIVNDWDEPLKKNVVVQFTTERTDKWHETELKYKGFKGGAARGDEKLTFLFSTAQKRGYTVTSYQQFVTATKELFAASVVQIIGQVEGGAIWEFATRYAELFEETASGSGKGDLNESIADGPSMPARSTTPCSSTSIKTRASCSEPPKEPHCRSARQSSRASQAEPDQVLQPEYLNDIPIAASSTAAGTTTNCPKYPPEYVAQMIQVIRALEPAQPLNLEVPMQAGPSATILATQRTLFSPDQLNSIGERMATEDFCAAYGLSKSLKKKLVDQGYNSTHALRFATIDDLTASGLYRGEIAQLRDGISLWLGK